MAENDGNHDLPGAAKVPVTPAPTHSQTNLASRAPGVAERPGEVTRPDIPQSAAKPPPEIPAAAEPRRRRGDVTPVAGDFQGPSACPAAELHEDAPRRNRWMIGAECLLVLICVVPGILTRNRLDHGYVAPAHPAVTARGGQEFRPTGELAGLPDNAGAAFTTALDDLDNAVAAFPQQSPEEILKTVSRPGRDCMLLWNKDYPSVLYGTPPIRPDSLTANLEACAEAVKRLSR